MTARRFISNVSSLTLAQLGVRGISVIWMIYLVRFLGVENYGIFATVGAFIAIFGFIQDPGIGMVSIREVAQERSQAAKYLGNNVVLRGLLSTAAFFLILIVAYIVGYPSDIILYLLIAGFGMIINAVGSVCALIFQAFEEMRLISILQILSQIGNVSLGFTALYLGYGLLGVFIVSLITAFIVGILYWLLTLKKFVRPKINISLKLWKYLFKEGVPIGLAAFFFLVYYRVDTLMLSIMVGNRAVGIYNASYVWLIALIELFNTPFVRSVYPILSRSFVKSRENFEWICQRSVFYSFLWGLPVATGVALLAKRFIFLIYGLEYIDSVIVLQILIWTIIFTSMYAMFEKIFIVTRLQKIILALALSGVIINVGLNYMLIPKFSYIGASISTLITEASIFTVYLIIVTFKYQQSFLLPKMLVKCIISCIIMGVFIYYFIHINLLLLVILSAIIYIGSLLILKTFSQQEISIIKSAFIKGEVQ